MKSAKMKHSRYNPRHELSEVFKQYFKFKETSYNTWYRFIPSGDLGLFDYDRGLCWIKLQTAEYPGDECASIIVIVGNIDDGMWRAETAKIKESSNIHQYLQQLREVIDDMTKLPSSDELSRLLSIAVNPYILHGEFK